MLWMLEAGVDGMTANYPDVLLEVTLNLQKIETANRKAVIKEQSTHCHGAPEFSCLGLKQPKTNIQIFLIFVRLQ